MNARILNTTPVSGTNPEKHFGEHAQISLWVEFEDDNNYQKWNASFAKEYDKGFSTLVLDNKNNTAFISAGAQGYLIDTTTRDLILQTEKHQSILSAVYSEKFGYIIFSNFWEIKVYKGRELVREIRPVNVDGIYFTECSNNIAFGHLEEISMQRPNIVFELDLLNFEMKYQEINTKKVS